MVFASRIKHMQMKDEVRDTILSGDLSRDMQRAIIAKITNPENENEGVVTPKSGRRWEKTPKETPNITPEIKNEKPKDD